MRLLWNFLSKIYSELYCAGLKIPKLKLLFHQPIKKLDCQYADIIFADISFTTEERELILEALNDLHLFCNGLITLKIYFNLDNYDQEIINNNNVLLRVDGKHPSIIASDTKIEADTIGLCDYMTNHTKRLYLVHERLNQPIIFRTTAIHELGHFIGLSHTEKPSVMHKSNFSNVLYPTYNDAQEVAKVWGINADELSYFKL